MKHDYMKQVCDSIALYTHECHLEYVFPCSCENVFEKCNHASVDKTLRILLDFYISVVLKDDDMERRFFSADPN